jgi:hypothetical protein
MSNIQMHMFGIGSVYMLHWAVSPFLPPSLAPGKLSTFPIALACLTVHRVLAMMIQPNTARRFHESLLRTTMG